MPGRGVTSLAISISLRVGGNSSQRSIPMRAQGTGTIHQSAPCITSPAITKAVISTARIPVLVKQPKRLLLMSAPYFKRVA